MRIYNSLGREKQEFKPIRDNCISMYVCGPTIYDYGHLGHGRSAVNFDVIRRYFIYKGYRVKFVFNYTDIDDKLINRAGERKISAKQLAEEMAKVYDEDYEKLGILKPDVNPYATQYINEMIEIIKLMEKNNFTYVIENDGIYYDISKFPQYGKLSCANLDEQITGVRKDITDKKRNPQDFVLWKFKKEGEPFWPSPWGDGRPGWHIECTAMIKKNLGIPFDIHGGGMDLQMPHHEAEIAQGYAAFGPEYCNFWIHNGFINVDNQKMSKSLGNFFTLRDIFKKFDPKVVRFFILQTHYRMPVNFADILLEQSKSGLERINNFIQRVHEANGNYVNIKNLLENTLKRFEESMDDDFETSGALAAVFDLIKEVNILLAEGKISRENKEEIFEVLKKIDSVFNVMAFEKEILEIPEEIKSLLDKREQARKEKKWQEADALREKIREKGYEVLDTPEGAKIKKIN